MDEPWTVHPIAEDIPTIHRIRFADYHGHKPVKLVAAPLMGRDSTAAKNWSEHPVHIQQWNIPDDPLHDRWIAGPFDNTLHVVHNFDVVDLERYDQNYIGNLLVASYEGVTWVGYRASLDLTQTWRYARIGLGDQSQPDKNRGASEVRLGRIKDKQPIIATIEPWHGNQVVIYRPDGTDLSKPWKRTVIDKELKWGHALAWADLDGDGQDELIVGVRDSLSPKDQCGVRIYRLQSDGRWISERLDPGGVAVEDMVVADLNGDGKPDIIAVGRATGNVRIYWNEQ